MEVIQLALLLTEKGVAPGSGWPGWRGVLPVAVLLKERLKVMLGVKSIPVLGRGRVYGGRSQLIM